MTNMRITAVKTALPPHYYDQETLLAAFLENWSTQHFNTRRVEQFHKAVRVGGRHLALPIEEYPNLRDFTAANNHFIRVGTDLGELAISRALAAADLTASDVDVLFFVSVTGVATPSIDAKLMNRLGFRSDMKRVPIFGLGCVAGAAGLGRVHDYLVGHPNDVAVLLSVELCSLTLQRQDLSIPNMIASGLFGDGAAAVVAVGDQHPTAERGLVRVCESRSRFYPDTEGVMGWKIGRDGFKIVLEATVPALAEAHLADDLDAFLTPLGLTRSAVTQWVCHTGGPKVIDAFQSALGLEDADLELTRNSLVTVGNLSSASVLFVLADTLEMRTPAAGTLGVLMAMGPGFCNEMVLLKW